jgi:hypothetical protein
LLIPQNTWAECSTLVVSRRVLASRRVASAGHQALDQWVGIGRYRKHHGHLSDIAPGLCDRTSMNHTGHEPVWWMRVLRRVRESADPLCPVNFRFAVTPAISSSGPFQIRIRMRTCP